MPQGKGNQMHNRREYEKIGRPVPENIDTSKSFENVTLVDKDIREAYNEIFGEALKRYNAKQKRADRIIENYYDHILKSKNGEKPFYEDVVQWGSKDDFSAPESRQKAREALERYVSGFEERNSNLRVIGAYIHMDEASPHLHIDYIPVAHGYSRGLATRNSLDRAMKEMGFKPENESRKNNATKLWKENERAVFGEICRDLGLEVEEERKSNRKNLSVEEYKDAREQMLGNINQEYAEKKTQIENLDKVASYIATDGQEMLKAENMTIPQKKSFWGKIEASERVGVFVENMDKEQIKALMQRVNADERIEDTVNRTQEQCQTIIAEAKKEAESIKSEATAERNSKIAEAEKIVRDKQSIMDKVKEWGNKIYEQGKELTEKIKHLTAKKEKLETEVGDLQKQKEKLEPLRAEVQELTRAKEIMTGAVENEISQSKFYVPIGNAYSADYKEKWDRLENGTLLALYKDGSLKVVTGSRHTGMDNSITNDNIKGLCRIGWFKEEEKVTIPRNLLRELITVRDVNKPISKNLENMIDQQTTVNRVITKIKSKEQER